MATTGFNYVDIAIVRHPLLRARDVILADGTIYIGTDVEPAELVAWLNDAVRANEPPTYTDDEQSRLDEMRRRLEQWRFMARRIGLDKPPRE